VSVVPFPQQITHPTRTLEGLLARKGSPHISCDVTVTSDTRARRYMLWSDAPDYFVGEVWFDGCFHRRKRVAGVVGAMRMADEFAREIRDLLTDGWTTL
jgi:hypothetical protein